MEIGMAQLETANENEDMICAGPVYPMTDRGGHLDANGYRWYGEMLGKAYYRTKVLGQRFVPLQPIEISRTDNAKEIKIRTIGQYKRKRIMALEYIMITHNRQ